ncbi:hypothetical protein FRC09_004422 [Ceratobasidium sp. 395]|nr:hypothetical protein FRC09_004422 [Ceratobasidium sp. 395]
MVTYHIKYLRARYRRQTDPHYISKEKQRLLDASARTRKRTLYNHRLQMINEVPALRVHGRLFETMGLDGTSSDEEDRSRGRGIYVIRRRKQFSPQLNHLKNQIDESFSIRFKGPGTKGNQMRKRIDVGVFSKRRLKVKGLPISVMNPTWLVGLTDVQKAMYEFRDMQYKYVFPEELLDSPENQY